MHSCFVSEEVHKLHKQQQHHKNNDNFLANFHLHHKPPTHFPEGVLWVWVWVWGALFGVFTSSTILSHSLSSIQCSTEQKRESKKNLETLSFSIIPFSIPFLSLPISISISISISYYIIFLFFFFLFLSKSFLLPSLS